MIASSTIRIGLTDWFLTALDCVSSVHTDAAHCFLTWTWLCHYFHCSEASCNSDHFTLRDGADTPSCSTASTTISCSASALVVTTYLDCEACSASFASCMLWRFFSGAPAEYCARNDPCKGRHRRVFATVVEMGAPTNRPCHHRVYVQLQHPARARSLLATGRVGATSPLPQ